MSNRSHLDTPDFPLQSSGAADGPCHRQAHEIGCGAVVIRSTIDSHTVCLKLDRIGKEYIHHYVIDLNAQPQNAMQLIYVDPEELLFDCLATLDFKLGTAEDIAPDVGHAFENKDGYFLKILDDPKAQKMLCFADLGTGLVRIRQDRKLKSVHPNWTARANFNGEVIDLAQILDHFADQLPDA